MDTDYIKEKLYQQLAIDYCCQVSDIKDDKFKTVIDKISVEMIGENEESIIVIEKKLL